MSIRGIRYDMNLANDGINFYPPRNDSLFYTESGSGLVLPSWPSQATHNFWLMRPAGVFYFRDLKGNLVNKPIGNPVSSTLTVNNALDALGAEIAQLDDFYICLAKRYYQYFMGVDITLTDPKSPDEPRSLSLRDQEHLAKVTSLGLELKQSQNVMSLIETIVKSVDYRKSDYGQ